jgi:hypothetical protein
MQLRLSSGIRERTQCSAAAYVVRAAVVDMQLLYAALRYHKHNCTHATRSVR